MRSKPPFFKQERDNTRALACLLNKTGPWMAMFKEYGNKIGHFAVVDGVDHLGRVVIRDPYDQTIYKMNKTDFIKLWNCLFIYKT